MQGQSPTSFRATPSITALNSPPFEDPEADRQEAQLQGEIQVLEQQIASTQLKPLMLDPEFLRLSQDASDSQRARLTQLGYGVLRSTPAGPISTQAINEDEFVAAQRAQSHAAETQFERTSALVQAGVMSRDKLEVAEAAAQTAAQDLRERENLIREAKAGPEAVAHTEAAILRDNDRAKAERTAELEELNARLSEFRASLLQFHMERSVTAPFSGTVVYRHPSPALVEDGKVILALAKGPGFLAIVQLPAREASMLVPGQQLRMKLKHSLVSEEVSGHLQSIQPVAGYPDRRNLLIECALPPEQFTEFSSGTIPVTLQWRPPLYSDRVAEGGLALSILPIMMWPFRLVRRKTTQSAATSVDKLNQTSSVRPSYSVEEAALHELSLKLEEAFKHQAPSSPVLKQVERAVDSQPAKSAQLVKAGVFEAMNKSELPVSAVFADPMKEEMYRVLAQLGLTSEDLLTVSK
jgi:hypothetical protein